jgi:hypothetical protein
MFLTKTALPRRTFLQAAGAAVALPFLDSMAPALSAQAVTSPKRYGFIYLPHGFIMQEWTPEKVGTGFEFKRIMKPLEPLRDRMVVVSGLDGAPNGGSGGHATGPASFLSGVSPRQTEGNDVRNGATVDQVIARKVGQDTVFPSLEIATEDFAGAVGACEIGFSCIYLNTIAWQSSTEPLPMEINPRVLFERMFGGAGTLEERITRMRENRSILDRVMQQSARLQSGLGPKDRARVTEYLDNIREIERRIQKAEQQSRQNVEAPSTPSGIPADFGEHTTLLLDLMTVAYQADLTRVFSFMLARDLHSRAYPDLGVPEGHHSLSHHGGDAEKIAHFTLVNTYHMLLLSQFLQKLGQTPDGDGTLLDHSMITIGSGMSNGNAHSHVGIPFVVAGNGVKGGRHLLYPRAAETPHANLLLTVAQHAGVDLGQFGLSRATVEL